MSQRRHAVKILGLSLLATLGLMSMTTAAAHAGDWTIGSGSIGGSLLTAQGIGQEEVEGRTALGKLLVPAIGLTIHCTDGEIENATILLGGTAHATILFLGCTVEGSSVCHIYPTELDAEMGTNAGHITASGLGLLLLMGTEPVKHYLLLEEHGAPFTTVYFEGAGCNLPFENEITGSTVVEIPEALVPKVNQRFVTLSKVALEALFPSDVLKFGGHVAWLDEGTATAWLSGLNEGEPWGAE